MNIQRKNCRKALKHNVPPFCHEDNLHYDDMYMLLGTSLIHAFSFQDRIAEKRELQTSRFPSIITQIKQRINARLKLYF